MSSEICSTCVHRYYCHDADYAQQSLCEHYRREDNDNDIPRQYSD